jgi:hypothetical protein
LHLAFESRPRPSWRRREPDSFSCPAALVALFTPPHAQRPRPSARHDAAGLHACPAWLNIAPCSPSPFPAALCPLPLAASRACGSLTQRSASATSTGGVDHLNAAPSLVSVAQPRQEPSIHLQSTGPPAACHLPPALNQLHALDDTQHTLGWASKGPRQIKSQLRAPSLHPFHRGSWFHAGLCLLPRRFSKILRAPR